MKKWMIFAVLLVVPAAFAQEKPKLNPGVYANFETSLGNFTAELFEKDAPGTVANFIGLAEGTKDWKDPKTGQTIKGKHFYDGLIFHRVIDGFMIQGGDPTGTGMGGPGYSFEDEFNDHKVERGALAMANAGPNTNGSQFFVVTAEATPWLDGKHTVFGRVTSGLEVADAISLVETGPGDRPSDEVVIERVELAE